MNLLSYINAEEYFFIKEINLPKGKIAINAYDSLVLIYDILPNNEIMLQAKIDMEDISPLCLYYIVKQMNY